MNCFNHSDVPANGLCKHCFKGLCADCATDLEHGLACKGKHETEVEAVRAMVTRANRQQAAQRGNRYLSPIFFAVFGSLFVGYGLVYPGPATELLKFIGVGFVLYAIVVFRAVRNAFK